MWTLIQGPTLFQESFTFANAEYQLALYGNCTAPLEAYRASSGTQNGPCEEVLDCILGHVTETYKASIGVTAILLGLSPTVLSILGSQTMELSLLSTKRPFLSLLIALGAPVVAPTRLFDHANPRDFLQLPESGLPLPKRSSFAMIAVPAVEYALVLAAFANVTTLAIQIGFLSPSAAVGCGQHFHVLFWTYLAASIHGVGLLSFFNRAQLQPLSPNHLAGSRDRHS